MDGSELRTLAGSRWSKRTGRVIDGVCFIALLATIATVIYGFMLRAIWANGYYVAAALAFVGALVILIGIAQQAIAARDAATWRSMAEWQIRAARAKIAGGARSNVLSGADDPDSPVYYEHLVEALLDNVQREDQESASR